MPPEIIVRDSEAAKVISYTKALQLVQLKAETIGLVNALQEWSREISLRRLAWFEEHGKIVKFTNLPVRNAFQLLMLEYMGVPPQELPILYEDECSITWRSHNYCPYLEAIRILGMDTRVVCRHATHTPCQDLIDSYMPGVIIFSRNYDKIRPYADYCEETIRLDVSSVKS